MKIAFICLGNTCRSQMALGIAKHYYSQLGSFYSAGIKPGNIIEANTIRALENFGIERLTVSPQGINALPEDIEYFVIMDANINLEVANAHIIRLDVKDPFGSDYENYCLVRDQIFRDLAKMFRNITEV